MQKTKHFVSNKNYFHDFVSFLFPVAHVSSISCQSNSSFIYKTNMSGTDTLIDLLMRQLISTYLLQIMKAVV